MVRRSMGNHGNAAMEVIKETGEVPSDIQIEKLCDLT